MHRKVMNASGKLINPFDLKPEDHDPKIVAQTLSRVCRFWGQTSEFYSVAQHCLTIESLFEDLELKRWAMLHEWFEGLTGMDVPTPIKHSKNMAAYRKAEEKCLDQAAELFGLTPPMPAVLKIADKRMMVTEALKFMNSENYDWLQYGDPYDLSIITTPMSMKEAQEAFMAKWNELF